MWTPFCGAQYRFDAIDIAQIFRQTGEVPPASEQLQ